MEIDSTPFDVMVRLDDGVAGRAEMTGLIDLATRSITAVVLRPSTKSVDAALLLARTITPEPMRPGWPDALRMEYSALPYRRLLAIDDRLRHAAAVPVIIPETVVIDGGAAFVSDNFSTACDFLGVEIIHAPPGTPTQKPRVAYCTSSERLAGRWRSCRSQGVVPTSLVGGRRVGAGPVVEDLSFVVIPLATDNSGVVPDLDGAGGHAEQGGHLGERDQAGVGQPLAAAG